MVALRRSAATVAAVLALHGTHVRASDDVAVLKAENALLKQQIERMQHLMPAESVIERHLEKNMTAAVAKIEKKEILLETAEFMACLAGLAFMWAVPRIWPFRRCCAIYYHRVYPMILIFTIIGFCVTLNFLQIISANQIFFRFVEMVTKAIDIGYKLCIATAALFALGVLWKFKDRILEAMGVENPSHYCGSASDWATCWSMKRFQPVELFIYKVEDIPSAALHTNNDLYVEVQHGYNVGVRTRVHHQAGHTCSFKETMAINFDPYDSEATLTLTVRHQNVLGGEDISQVQLGAQQILSLKEPGPIQANVTNWGGSSNTQAAIKACKQIDLVPAGKIWLRFNDTVDEEVGACDPCCGCCMPSNKAPGDRAVREGELSMSKA